MTIYPALYVLKLEGDNWYVGMSYNLNIRWAQHWSGNGAKWTKLHPPISVERVIFDATEEGIENRITLQMMEIYGNDKVRGGSYCKV